MRAERIVVLSLVFASALTAAEVTIDPTTGLWYPPYASREAYLKREPGHSYIADVHRAWRENPGLMREVCTAVLRVGAPPTADGSVLQLRTMLSMQCMAETAATRAIAQEATISNKVSDELMILFAKEEASIGNVAPKEKGEAASALFSAIRTGDLAAGLRAIAVDPAYTESVYELLTVGTDTFRMADGRTYERRRVAPFLHQLYATRAKSDRPDAAEWKAGLPAVLLYLGDVDEARLAATEWASRAPADRSAYARTMVAVIDRVSGNPGALDRLVSDCRRSPAPMNKENKAPDDCFENAMYLVRSALETQKERAPRALAEAAYDLIRIDPHHWPAHMMLLGALRSVDPAGARKHLYDVFDDGTAPEGAVLDATYYLAKLALQNDPATAAPLFDCWLKMHGLSIPPLPLDPWRKLASMEEGGPALTEDCFGPGTSKVDSYCAVHALQMRFQAAADARQWDVARQSVEKMLAVVLASHAAPSLVRDELMNLATFETEAGLKDEPELIRSYLHDQPHDAYVSQQLVQAVRVNTPNVQQPWTAPATVDSSHLSQQCPPPRPKPAVAARKIPAPPHIETPAEYEAALRRRGYVVAGALLGLVIVAVIIRRHA